MNDTPKIDVVAAISSELNTFAHEHEKWEGGNKSAGVRARKALMSIKKLAADARKQITRLPENNSEAA